MVTLTEAASYSKKIVVYGILIVIFLILIVIAWGLVRDYIESQRPEPGIITTNGFGQLPKLNFPEQQNRPSFLTLQTIQGGVPEASPVARVYKTESGSTGLLTAKKAQQFAISQGFNPTPTTKTATEHIFSDPSYPARTLTYTLASGNFDLVYDLNLDKSPIEGNKVSTDTRLALAEATALMQNTGKLVPTLKNGIQKVNYYKYINGEEVLSQNRLEANLVRVDFFQEPVDSMEIKTADPNKSSVFITFTGKIDQRQRLIRFHYQLSPIDIDSIQTYPIKAGNVAWEELVNGGGYVVNIGTGNETRVFVRDAYFAYYDPGDPHEYLQPIYVLTGDRGFEAYIQAIDPAWVQ